jgi:hypothetical protein
MDIAERRGALDDLYKSLANRDRRAGGRRRLAECDGRMDWPRRGVYFFFEDGEFREDGLTPRVVRVGTHALKQSKSTLWGRLAQHKGNVGGRHPHGGNHRGSIFRLHVGTALLASGGWPDSVHETWGVGGTARGNGKNREYPLECAVSTYIGKMPFLWLDVDDKPSPASHRGVIERGAIALLSNYQRPAIDAPSPNWLGHHASREAISQSGIWNVNHVQDLPGLLSVETTCLMSQ